MERPFKIYTIEYRKIKRLFYLDIVTGTGFYYIFKFITASVLIGTLGSILTTEGIKKCHVYQEKKKKLSIIKK